MKPILCKKKSCTGCGVCASSCKYGAITMTYNSDGFLMPEVNQSLCVGCHACERKCPIINAGELVYNKPLPSSANAYTVWTSDDVLCRKASSGGVFSQLALDFLSEKDTFVAGVEQSDNSNECRHVLIGNPQEIGRIIGTRYIQSDASLCYKEIKKHLTEGARVLFVGTPCQVAGLYSFMGKSSRNLQNLTTCELLCHGVTSKLAVDLMCKVMNADYVSSYRNKDDGWCEILSNCFSQKSQCCTFVGNDGKKKTMRHTEDIFYKSFGMFHRNSCYRCLFAKPERTADITLGDQWAAAKNYKERLTLGASLVIVNTAKGKELLSASSKLCIHEESLISVVAPPFFAPAMTPAANMNFLLRGFAHLPISIVKRWMANDSKRFWPLIPYKIAVKIGNKIRKKHRQEIMKQTIEKYGWR